MYKFIFRILISCLLIFYFSFKADWNVINEALKKINITWYIVSTTFGLFGPVFLACKYFLLIKNTNLQLTLPRLVAVNFISRFYSLFLPSALASNAARWYKVTNNKQGRSFFLASTIVERIFFMLILVLFGIIPLFFYTENQQIILLRDRLFPLLAIVTVLLCLALLFFLFPAIRHFILNFVQNKFSKHKESKINQFLKNFAIKQSFASIFLPLLIFSLLWQGLYIFRMFFLFSALQLPVELLDVIWMGSLVLMLQTLPVSIAGLGIREGAYAYLFTLYGLPAEKGVLLGILFFSQMLIMASIGGILELIDN